VIGRYGEIVFGEVDPMECCGIVGFVGNEPASRYLIDGLRILESRGYDSAGIATSDPSTKALVNTKCASTASTADAIEKVGVPI